MVAEERRIDVTVLKAPKFDATGKYEVLWQVTNNGNTTEGLELSAESTPKAEVRLTPARLDLAPGESVEVRGMVQAPQVSRLQPLTVALNVQQSRGAPIRSSARTDLIPSSTSTDQLYHVFPLRVTAGATVGSPGSNVDFRISGKGRPVQGDPGTLELSATRHSFSLSYARKEYAWTVGQLSTQTNPLLTGSLLGASATLNREEITYGAFGGDRAGHLVVGTTLGIKHQLGQTQFGVEASDGHLLAGVHGQYETRTDRFSVKAKGAMAVDLTTGAYAADATGSLQAGKSQLNVQYARTTAGWKGATTTAQLVSAGLSVQPTKELTLNVSAALKGAGPVTPSLNVSSTLRRDFGTVGVQYSYTPAQQTVAGTLSHTLGSLPLQHYVAWTSPPAATPEQGSRWQYQVTSAVKVGAHNLSPVLGLTHDSGTGNTAWYGGVRGSVKADSSTSLTYGLTTPNLMSGDFTAQVGATRTLSNATALTLDSSLTRSSNQWRAGVRLSGNLAVDVPVHPRTDIARLEGQVRNADGSGVPNVILRAGDTATVTDSQGKFVFPALLAGTVSLTQAGDSLPENVLLDPPLPLVLNLNRGETRQIVVQAIPVGAVTGEVALTLPSEDLLNGGGLMPDVPDLTSLGLQLTSQDGTTVTIAPNANGTFSFLNLNPGNYTLTFTPEAAALLSSHEVIPPSLFTLKAGETVQVHVGVTLRPREIRIDEAEDLGTPK
ncbi:MSCRAMM family protein [Deinococcus navajonensis]